jgi:hypothetical protein
VKIFFTHLVFVVLTILTPLSAFAEKNLFDFYGTLDLAVGHQSNGLPSNGNTGSSVVSSAYPNASNTHIGSQSGLWSGGMSQNRLGFKGSTFFSENWRAAYLLESGFNLMSGKLVNNSQSLADNVNSHKQSSLGFSTANTNGSQNGQLFNREAYASLAQDNWGVVRLGRNNTLINDIAQQSDPLQASQVFGFLTASSGFGGGSGVSETTRLNNSIKYLNQKDEFTLGLMHAWGDGTALASQGQMNGTSVVYAEEKYKLMMAYSAQSDALKEGVDPASIEGSTPTIPLKTYVYNSKGWILGASYELNPAWTLKAGASSYVLSNPKYTLTTSLTNTSTINGFDTYLIYYKGSDIKAKLQWVGVNHQATEKLNLYAAYYRASFDGFTSTFTGGTRATSGDVNWGSLLADYKIDSSKDIYFALADIHLTNTSSTSAISGAITSKTIYSPISHNTIVATGFRYKF